MLRPAETELDVVSETRAAPPADAARTSDGRPILVELSSMRLALQRQAGKVLRRHLERAVRRVLVLVLADGAAYLATRTLLRQVRDSAALGSSVADAVQGVLPRGLMSGWQYASALFVALVIKGTYGAGDQRRDPGRLFAASALATALPLWMTIWTNGLDLVAVQYTLVTIMIWMGLVVERLTLDHVVAAVAPTERHAEQTLFVGAAKACREAMSHRSLGGSSEFNVVGFVDSAANAAHDALGRVGDFGRILAETHAETVVLCGFLADREFTSVVDLSLVGGCHILAVPRAVQLAGVEPTLVWRGGTALVTLTAPALKARQLFVKRIIDVAGSGIGLIVLSPVFAAIALAVRLDSPGPALFRQQRVGLGGRGFGMLKFRTMVDGAEGAKASLAHLNQSGDDRLFKIPDDPRVTRLGRLLRRWSLDELPQLWNVFAGEMSLVGPRPFFMQDLPLYEAHHFERLGAKPGITGLWQVSGRSDVVDFEEVVRLDREYIDHWSPVLDITLLLRTLPAVLARRGAF